ncbi:MAG: flagellar basal body P-ring protein FlgI [Verrucomicrobia bacterium]|nr:flagellar basal body P-ring protein FlgI [Verrucomicrobiota bacterium]
MRNFSNILLVLSCLAGVLTSATASRIKDLTTIQGQRDNQLVGYGLVVGLAGDGDSQQADYTVRTIANMLQRFGVNLPADDLRSKNVAAVMVTADISAFGKPGSRLDVVVSSIGDADSLTGGVLLQTPLLGADDEVYAVAQGSVLVGGFSVGGADASIQKNHPTVGKIPGGAIIEREIHTQVIQDGGLVFLLRDPDYASAVLMAETINRFFPNSARALSPQSVGVHIPEEFSGSETTFIASVEAVRVQPDVAARVVMNERTGTIVATADVRLSEVAVSHGNITVLIARSPVISQPGALSSGETVVQSVTDIEVIQSQGGFSRLAPAPTLRQLTDSLNILGVSPRDMMSILQSLKTAGALHAELIIE